ncbi:MAG: ABC transporter permease [Candidatus Heimdallarchaeaceae archaeon]
MVTKTIELKRTKRLILNEELLFRANKRPLKYSLRVILAYAWKNLRNDLRYLGSWIYWMVVPLLWLIPYAFQGKALLGDSESSFFLKYGGTGDYFSYVALGFILFNIVDSAIWGAGNRLRWEQKSGTFEYIWMTPISRVELLLGSSFSELVWIAFVCTTQFLILNFILSWTFTIIQILLALVVIIVTLAGLFSFSFIFASIILIFKEPGTLSELTDISLNILLPVRYPLRILPPFLRWIGYTIPFAYGFFSIRAFTLAREYNLGFIYLAIQLILSAIMWMVGLKIFKRIEYRTRKIGQLGAY